jgi:hypothetical protein
VQPTKGGGGAKYGLSLCKKEAPFLRLNLVEEGEEEERGFGWFLLSKTLEVDDVQFCVKFENPPLLLLLPPQAASPMGRRRRSFMCN